MSSQSELNSNPTPFILYYCGVTHSDATVFQTDLSDVAVVSYDTSQNLQIDVWYVSGYAQPSMATLMTYSLMTVISWYNSFYQQPADVAALQPYKISSTSLAAMRVSSSMTGYTIYNTTTKRQQYLSSLLVWENCFSA